MIVVISRRRISYSQRIKPFHRHKVNVTRSVVVGLPKIHPDGQGVIVLPAPGG